MKRPLHSFGHHGSAILVALMFVFGATIAITGWMYLCAARLRQTEAISTAAQRHIAWGNSQAINQQYLFTEGFQANNSEPANTATLGDGIGGLAAGAYESLNVFGSTQTASNATGTAYAFNNLRVPPTVDGSVYYSVTQGGADSSQSESFSIYNYVKAYPTPLTGDLLIIHQRPAAATTGATFCPNLQVAGRVVIMDSTANAASVLANECWNNVATATNTTLNSTGTATLLPDNYAHVPTCTAGYGGSANPTAVTTGVLNVIDNPTFTEGSLKATLLASSNNATWTSTTPTGESTSPVYVTNESPPTYAPPTKSPYGYTYTSPLKVLYVNLLNITLPNICITGAYDQIVIEGQTNQTDYNTAGDLTPVIIMLENTTTRDIRLVGENNRPLILSTGQGIGQTVYLGFSGSSAIVGGPLRWRVQLINQYCSLWLSPPSGSNVTLTGSIRTDWSVSCTDSTSTMRFYLQGDPSPNVLDTLLPRDGWNESYFYFQ